MYPAPVRILIADAFESSGKDGLRALGCEVLDEPTLQGDALLARLVESGADVLVVRSTQVTRAMLEGGKLALVVRAGAGTNTIDTKAASERGVWVTNCPGKNAVAVAELAIGLVLAHDRHLAQGAQDLREGRWNKKKYSKSKGLLGRTFGVLGLGAIGRETAKRAAAFGMPIVAWSRSLTEARAEELGVMLAPSPLEVATSSDVVSVHLPLTEGTRGICNAEFFAAMTDGALFVNTSRAEVVDEDALFAELEKGRLSAAVDVFANEPKEGTGAVESRLFSLPNVIGSHHIGASTDQAQEATAEEVVRIVRLYRETGRPPNAVNLAKKSPATHLLVVRHYDRVGVLAAIFDCLKREGLNVQETENLVFDGAVAAIARIHFAGTPKPELAQHVRAASPDILEATLVGL